MLVEELLPREVVEEELTQITPTCTVPLGQALVEQLTWMKPEPPLTPGMPPLPLRV